MKQLYVIGRAWPAQESRYFIRRIADGRTVASDIEDRLYASLLCEAFNLVGERAERAQAEALVPESMKVPA